MRLKTWIVAALGLGSLVALVAFSVLTSTRKAEDIYAQLEQLNAHHQGVDASLGRLRSDVNLSGIFVRDYLLDISRERAPEYRDELTAFRRANIATLDDLEALIGRDDRIAGLRTRLDDYWETFDPLFDWTPAEKILRSASFLRREVVPRGMEAGSGLRDLLLGRGVVLGAEPERTDAAGPGGEGRAAELDGLRLGPRRRGAARS